MPDLPLLTHPFAPVFDDRSRILILGSFPSARSRKEGFYYGHPRNRFWPMLAQSLGEPLPETTGEKRALLLNHGIALWDVLSGCYIEGSSDSSIRSAVPNDLSVITRLASIRVVLCNGATAGKLCRTHCLNGLACEIVTLPSTSPANAAWSLERLCAIWKPWLSIE